MDGVTLDADLDEDYSEHEDDREVFERITPGPVRFSTVQKRGLPPLSPAIIDGVLRQGHKMLITGGSKASKSFALIELAIAIAECKQWLGWQCTQGRVLYVNLEVDEASCLHRFNMVARAFGITEPMSDRLIIWNLRGRGVSLEDLVRDLLFWGRWPEPAAAIIIDPIYKVMAGDENSAEHVAKFCNQLDVIASQLGCAVIYCHHHSKGSQGHKRSMDRASGSGVFARDADALLDFIELESADESALRIEGTLREFRAFQPRHVRFTHPIHVVDDNLKDLRARGERRQREVLSPQDRRQQRAAALENAFAAQSVDGTAALRDLAEHLSKTEKTVRGYVEEHEAFAVENSVVRRKEEQA